VQVRLITTETGGATEDGCGFTDATTPRVKSFGVSHSCMRDLG
jgi:hypothetical protein